MRSRSGLERLTALLLASGIILSSAFGGLHPLGSGHHPVGSHHQTGNGLAVMFAGETGAPAPHHPSHGGGSPSESTPGECPCLGGVCVVSIQAPPAERDDSDALGWEAPVSAAIAEALSVRAVSSHRFLQPPGTGPPAAI